MKKLIILFISVCLLTGCYNYKELSELALVSALSIEKEDDEFLINVQSVNVVDSNSSLETSPITIVSGNGKTISDAISSLNQKSSKVFFLSNLEYILLSPEVIENDLDEVLDYLSRKTSLPLNYLIITSTFSNPKDILSVLSKFDMSSYTNLSKLIKFSEQNYGTGYYLTIKDLLQNYLSYGIEPIFPNIYLKGENEEVTDIESLKKTDIDSFLELKTPVFFTKDKKEVSLSKDENLGFNFLINNVSKAVLTGTCEDDYFTIETLNSKTIMEDNLSKNAIKVNSEVEAEIVYYGCKEDFDKESNHNKVTKIIEDTIKNYIDDAINLAVKEQTDYIGIGNYIFKNNHKYFDFKNNNWNQNGLPKLNFDISVKVNLNKQGNLRSDIDE